MKKKTKRLTLNKFNAIIDMETRAKLLRESGDFIDERIIYGKYDVKTYTMPDFLGEVWTDLNKSEIQRVIGHPNQQDWELFLSRTRNTDNI